jgi:crotonobetainyl-CoA:carnitine CoA-transferase CaiB-like acyl-CoA transferase
MATGIFADQGADVIKVETAQGDLTRIIGPAKGDISVLFASINRGKRAIVLDLKKTEAVEVLSELLLTADVLVENFRPGALARLGFSYETVSAVNPRLIYVSISGFGQTGPYAGYRVYDPVIQAVSGFADAHPDPTTGEPQLMQTLMCDKVTALTAAQAIGAALYGRSQSGKGSKIELSMLDAALSFLWPEAMYNQSFLDANAPQAPEFGAQQKLWQTADGWLAIMTPQPDEFAGLCRTLGVPELSTDPRFSTIPLRRLHAAELRSILEPLMLVEKTDILMTKLGVAGVPVGLVNRKQDIAQDPQVLANQILQEFEQTGLGRMRLPRAAAQFSSAQPRTANVPHLGEHTEVVLRELGRSDVQIATMLANGAAQGRIAA